MSRVPIITWNKLFEIEETISELPVDLSDEKSSTTKFPFWEKHLLVRQDFLRAEQNGSLHGLKYNESLHGLKHKQWLGFDLNHYFGRVELNLVSLGRPISNFVGYLNYVEVFRENGDTLVAAKLPLSVSGDVTKFICRASSEEYAAIVRMAVRIDID